MKEEKIRQLASLQICSRNSLSNRSSDTANGCPSQAVLREVQNRGKTPRVNLPDPRNPSLHMAELERMSLSTKWNYRKPNNAIHGTLSSWNPRRDQWQDETMVLSLLAFVVLCLGNLTTHMRTLKRLYGHVDRLQGHEWRTRDAVSKILSIEVLDAHGEAWTT